MPPSPTRQQNGHASTPNETTPLLAIDQAGPTTQSNADIAQAKGVPVLPTSSPATDNASSDSSDDDRPLPTFQVFILCYTGMVTPLTFFCIFPFVSQMVRDVGVPELDVGFYTGLVESLYSLTQMLLMIFWGRLADRYGRKPVLVVCCAGTGVGMALFGFSSSIWHMMAARCMAGAFGGLLVIIRAMLGDISTPKTAARAFSLFAFSGNLGIFVGPFIGGLFSEPAKQFPKWFGGVQLFKSYPFALSNLITGGFCLSAVVLCVLFLEETLKEKNGAGVDAKPMSTLELVKQPGVGPVLFMYCWCAIIGLGFTAVIPVFWFTKPQHGGYGFSELQSSIFLATAGLSQALWLLLVFPPWQKRKGTGSVLYVVWHLYPFLVLLHPLASVFRRTGYETAFWLTAVAAQLITSGSAMAYTGCQLALNDIAPSHQTLGTLNALALTLTSGIRTVAPAGFASIFAVGAGNNIVYGYLAWVLISGLSFGYWIVLRYVPERALRAPEPDKKKVPEVEAEEGNGDGETESLLSNHTH